MPYVRVVIKCPRPKEKIPPPETIGEHIRQRRKQLGLYQRKVGKEIGVDEFTIHNWEKGKSTPLITHYPAIIRFLGYDPGQPRDLTIPELLKAKRRQLGLTQRQVARLLHVDPSTITGWEQGDIVLKRDHRRVLARFLGLPEIRLIRAMGERWYTAHQQSKLLDDRPV